MCDYQVIIIGGGPVGMALGIELGLLGIKTLIIEKHNTSLPLPRAQMLNPRSVEFLNRWHIRQDIAQRQLLSANFPLKASWCSGLAGTVYAEVDLQGGVSPLLSPENYLRVPLWITEQVMREKIATLDTVELSLDAEVIAMDTSIPSQVSLGIKTSPGIMNRTASYVVGCDGANSITRKLSHIEMSSYSKDRRQVISIVFQSTQLRQQCKLPLALLYYNLTAKEPAALGYIDDQTGLWYAQIFQTTKQTLTEINLDQLLNKAAGVNFEKKIIHANFWYIQSSLANSYRNNRVFLAGDAAHVMPPLGGHGLNTGLGDAVNLGWKLAAVLKQRAEASLLDSYEIERKPIAFNNIMLTKKNAEDAAKIRALYPPDTQAQQFAEENQRLSIQHSHSLGIALGYCYQHSPIIHYHSHDHYHEQGANYQPQALPGYFAPHVQFDTEKTLYDKLKLQYTLLTYELSDNVRMLAQAFSENNIAIGIIKLNSNCKKIYPNPYYLLRPDWHIAWTADVIPNKRSLFSLLKLLPTEIAYHS